MRQLFRYILGALLAIPLAATFALAEQSKQQKTKLTSGQDASAWKAVGRLEIRNLAYCTAVLISPDTILTAAHCLFDPRNRKTVAARDIQFKADLRNGRASATLQASAYVIHPEFDYDGTSQAAQVTQDLALVRLSSSAPSGFAPFSTGKRPRKGSDVSIVSYGKGRDDTAVLEEGCTVLARRSGMLVLNCDVEFGSSGAPVFQTDIAGNIHVVSVISSAIDLNGNRYALGTDLQRPLAQLNKMLADLPAGNPQPSNKSATQLPRVRVLGATQGSGAKFVRP